MQRLIDKRCAIKHLKELLKNSIMPTEWYEGAKSAITLLQKEPTVDAEPVVRCKDCIHREVQVDLVSRYEICGIRNEIINLNGFCDRGKRREDG